MIEKPAVMFDRDREWRALTRFVERPGLGATLGLVYGRRRQGKTYMLASLVRAAGGFMFSGAQQTGVQNLRALSAAYHQHIDRPLAEFSGWREAVEALFRLGEDRDTPVPVVLDEFTYLLDGEKGLASIIQIAIDPLQRAKERSRTRLVLCGSALGTMRNLLQGTAPLRGRAQLDMLVHPFRFRDAAAFWGLADQPELAFRVHALIGGTPAYRDMCGDPPSSAPDFDGWVCDRLLDPAQVMYGEGNVLLHQQPELSDPAAYLAVLAAVSRGAHRRSEIAAAVGRPPTAVGHPLAVLESVRLVDRVEDALRQQRATYRIAEPVIRLHQLVVAPNESILALGEARRVWTAVADTVAAQIYGPHFEDLARDWTLAHAGEQTLGGQPNSVRPATIACREHRRGHELDVVAIRSQAFEPDRIVAIGEAKATAKAVDVPHLARLEHLRELLPPGKAPTSPRLLLFGLSGFTAELSRIAGSRPDVELIDLERLYHGE